MQEGIRDDSIRQEVPFPHQFGFVYDPDRALAVRKIGAERCEVVFPDQHPAGFPHQIVMHIALDLIGSILPYRRTYIRIDDTVNVFPQHSVTSWIEIRPDSHSVLHRDVVRQIVVQTVDVGSRIKSGYTVETHHLSKRMGTGVCPASCAHFNMITSQFVKCILKLSLYGLTVRLSL